MRRKKQESIEDIMANLHATISGLRLDLVSTRETNNLLLSEIKVLKDELKVILTAKGDIK